MVGLAICVFSTVGLQSISVHLLGTYSSTHAPAAMHLSLYCSCCLQMGINEHASLPWTIAQALYA